MPGKRRPRGRTIATAAAVGVIAVAAVAVAQWEPLATRYYAYRLNSDRGYLDQLVDAPELNAAQKEALRRYCQTDEGGTTLINAFVAATLAAHDYVDTLARSSTVDMDIGIDADGNLWFRAIESERQLDDFFTGRSSDPAKRRWRRLHDLLRHVDGQEFNLERYPTLRFKVEWREPGSGEPAVRAVRQR